MARNIATNRQEITKPRVSVDEASTHSLSFDGVDDIVSCGNDSSLQISTGTIGTWFRTVDAGGSYRLLFGKTNAYGLFLKDNVLMIYDWGGTGDSTTNINVGDGKWHFASVSFNSGITNGTNIYLDGIKVLTTTMTISNQATGLRFGFGGQYPKAGIGSSYVFSTALTAQQISDLYYNKIVPRETLVAEYFKNIDTDGAGTSLVDTSGNGNDGTISGASWSIDTDSKARMTVRGDKSSLLFSTNDDILISSPANIPDTGSVSTIDVSVKFNNLSATQAILSAPNASSNTQVVLRAGRLNLERGGAQIIIDSGLNPEIGVWHHITFTWDGTTNYAYIDGVKTADTTTAHGTAGAVTALWLSTYDGTNEPILGKAKSAKIWSSALTPQQIHDLHFKNIIPTDNLVLNLSLNEGAGDTAYDTSGNGNDGTITGATWSGDVPSPARNLAV